MFKSPEVLYRAIFDSARFSVIATRLDGVIYYCNQYALELLGYSAEEIVDKETPELIHDLSEVSAMGEKLSLELGMPVAGFEAFVAKARLGQADENQWTYVSKTGERIPVLLSVTEINDDSGYPCGFLGIAKDLREVEHLKLINEESEERFRRLADAAFEAIAISRAGEIIDCNDQCLMLMDTTREEMIGRNMMDYIIPEDRGLVAQRIKDDYQQVYKITLIRDDCTTIPVEISGRVALWDHQEVRISAIRDIKDRSELERELQQKRGELKEKNRQLKHMAMHDELTGIANRRSAKLYLDELLSPTNPLISILMIDVDHFKNINDTWGHSEGDQVLQGLVAELNTYLRAADMLARWGGEEFICILPDTGVSAAESVAEKLRSVVEKSLLGKATVTISIGVASTEFGQMQIDQLLRCADHALYAAKSDGRNRVVMDPGWI
ncbi:sensor domain-containing diguanylate cyclase [Neptuniibacter caesariensis]|uniref:diguanylate cyclase n=1 Tax=Neptuniibacter caesariensis TaxID=207954 RepID=A0A7U8C4N7_NEPCE|nr:sensor domain-containing diguanylate cyclase [Neptuniibacter caesariensis]EAR61457.1 PAS:GGDEF protein [Oceanospirillum sp. MED92] [Neptuniibacter caesariensis]